ncbi:MAG: nuclear transport factor 2 family protein [Acidimicrobiales bacterium]
MDTDATRALVEAFLEARANNDASTIDSLVSDDVHWALPVGTQMESHSGREAVVAALTGGAAGHLLKMETIKRTVNRLVVDGDTAVAFQQLTAELVNGGTYENEYAWRYTCADGKVTRLDEYVDTLHAFRQMGLLDA